MTPTPPDIPASSGFRNCLTRARVVAVRIVATNILKTRIEQAIEYALKAASFIICGMESGPPSLKYWRSVSEPPTSGQRDEGGGRRPVRHRLVAQSANAASFVSGIIKIAAKPITLLP